MKTFLEQISRDELGFPFRKAVLLLLFLAGLYFWIPSVYYAVVDDSPTAAEPEAVARREKPAAIIAETSFADASPDVRNLHPPRPFWNAGGPARYADPVVQSAEAAAIGSETFRNGGHDVISPVVMEKYADVDASELSPGTSDPESTQRSDTAGLDLKSTIIGVNRRAAYINRKLYFEGSTVEIDGESYKLVSVSPGKAVLRRGYETVELTIPESGPSRHAELDADGGARRR